LSDDHAIVGPLVRRWHRAGGIVREDNRTQLWSTGAGVIGEDGRMRQLGKLATGAGRVFSVVSGIGRGCRWGIGEVEVGRE
jgi:hypothetical protein